MGGGGLQRGGADVAANFGMERESVPPGYAVRPPLRGTPPSLRDRRDERRNVFILPMRKHGEVAAKPTEGPRESAENAAATLAYLNH